MKRLLSGIAVALACGVLCSTAYAIIIVGKGNWPASWPRELGSLRSRSRTISGPSLANQKHSIPFDKREEFEAAWPHLVSVKTAGTSIVLRQSPLPVQGKASPARVIALETPNEASTSIPRESIVSLVVYVDGSIIDLNRIALPVDTPIIDERFKDSSKE